MKLLWTSQVDNTMLSAYRNSLGTGGASALEPEWEHDRAQRGPPTRQAGPSGAQPCAARGALPRGGTRNLFPRREGWWQGGICTPPALYLRPRRCFVTGRPLASPAPAPPPPPAPPPGPGQSRGPDIVRGGAPRPSGAPRGAMRGCAPASHASPQEPWRLAWGVRGSADARGAADTPEQRAGAWPGPCAGHWRDVSRRL